MEVQGKVKVIGEVKEYGSNGFKKAELILDVTENPDYPQFVNIDVTQDNTDLLKNYKVGDQLKVSINIGGREWINPEGVAKYFNSITGWRIEVVGSDVPPMEQATETINSVLEPGDDLPF
tara:strand:- start:925 stop:1284 length:360 start_codon:yes stop_codon:yes gene_type:complete